MWGNSTLFHREKSIENCEKKINIDIINLEKFFDRSTDLVPLP